MRPNRGASLTETLVVMAIGGVISALSIDILHNSQVSARDAQDQLTIQRGLASWEPQLRADLRGATAVQLADEQTLVIDSGSSSVRYDIEEKGVLRSSIEGEKTVATEGFRLPSCQISFQLPENDLVVVEIVPHRPGKSAREFIIRQSVGRP